jgi:hypothetical protein
VGSVLGLLWIHFVAVMALRPEHELVINLFVASTNSHSFLGSLPADRGPLNVYDCFLLGLTRGGLSLCPVK